MRHRQVNPATVQYSKVLYVWASAVIIFSPVLTFFAAIKLRLSPPDAYGMLFLGLAVFAILPMTLGLARIGGKERYEAFLQKMEHDARIGRRPIVLLWITSSLLVTAIGVMGR